MSASTGRLIIPPEEYAMSDNPTQETPNSRSFEERVFARFDAFDGRLTTLEEKVDSRLRETRPIWEAMQADLASIKDGLTNVNFDLAGVKVDLANVKDDLAGVRDDMTKVRGDIKEIKYTLKAMHKETLRVKTDQEELDERIEKLESQSTS